MTKKPTVTTLQSGFNSTETLNANFEALRDAFDNTLSLDGSTPNAMEADLDLNGNNIIGAVGLSINGTDYIASVEAAKTAALAAQAAAELAETNAETAEINAESSETAAGLSATAAASSETASDLAKTAAELAETNAETAETNAAASATNAATSATTASTGASTASTKASEAATSATNAATSATESETAKTAAEAAADAALAALDSFDDRYLGAKASDPTLDNDGNALVAGALYYNTTDDAMKVYEGSVWVAAYASLSGALLQANNLSDLASVASARSNLGLGTSATTDSTAYATAAQGALADTATQPADLSTVATTGAYSDLSGKPTLGTAAATDSTAYATAAQGVTADSAVQVTGDTMTGALAINGDLTVDTNTLFVDAAGNNVGIGTASPSKTLHNTGDSRFDGVVYAYDEIRVNQNGYAPTHSNNLSDFAGARIFDDGSSHVFSAVADQVLLLNRITDDGAIITFYQAGNSEGNISVSGTTVSFNGGHLARWSQTADNSRIEGLLKGTVLTNLEQMAVWGDEDNEQLNCMAVSSVEGDPNVSGLFVNWDNDDQTYTADMNIAMTGDFIIRIAEGTTVERGDLLMSAGDGTAKTQGDDIVRSKTIAKVTSTHVTCTYEDGSYCVPCVVMAC